MIILKKAISRRFFLRGTLGTAIGLPLLDAMVPALTAQARTAAKPVLRFGALYWPNGMLADKWFPSTVGRDFEFAPAMKPLEPFRDQLLTVSGLVAPRTPIHVGDGAAWLNGAGVSARTGDPIHSEKSIDQYIVDMVGAETPLPSIEIGVEDMGTAIGSCNEFPCIYANTLAWRNSLTPLPVEINPRTIFERMFGEVGDPGQRRTRLAYKRSVLDAVMSETQQLQRAVGSGDRAILDQYLDNIREVERQIQQVMKRNNESVDAPAAPAGIPDNIDEHYRIMYDLMFLALQADISRVFTFMLAMEASSRTYPHLGFTDGHHSTSHHGNNPELVTKYVTIVTYHTALFANLLQRLEATPDGDGSILDHSLMMIGSGMGNGNVHDRNQPPMAIVGGAVKAAGNGGKHVRAEGKALHNMLFNVGEMAGVQVDRWVNATERLAL